MSMASAHATIFAKYSLEAETLCLGERIRGGLFRPCTRIFRYSSLVGALTDIFGNEGPIHAVARLVQQGPNLNRTEILRFAPRDRGRDISVLPLEVEYLADVRAEVYVLKNSFTQKWPKEFFISMGALKSKGFGRCHLTYLDDVQCDTPRKGILVVRIPEDDMIRGIFGIRSVITPVYGYLFRPTSTTSGIYTRSLFEGTELVAFDPILK